MKIPQSVRNVYAEILPRYQALKVRVDNRIFGVKSARWHYESRVKEEESYALKLETGRERFPHAPEDMLGCMLVVENHSKVQECADLVIGLFKEEFRRPPDSTRTTLSPHNFSFDDLRLYVRWNDVESSPPTGLNGILFEIQIKTYLQHAWGIAVHDLIYKTDSVGWGAARVAFQVKAMLENAELSISEAQKLTACPILNRSDDDTITTISIMSELKRRWPDDGALPKDVLRLAKNVLHLKRVLRLELADIWNILDSATGSGRGAKLLNLSPYGAILESLVMERKEALFSSLSSRRDKDRVFVPLEIDLPNINADVLKFIVRPKLPEQEPTVSAN